MVTKSGGGDRLKAALGTTSSDFVNATLVQIQNASRMPSGGISETSVNAVLAFIEAVDDAPPSQRRYPDHSYRKGRGK